jgi:hypothetical protein
MDFVEGTLSAGTHPSAPFVRPDRGRLVVSRQRHVHEGDLARVKPGQVLYWSGKTIADGAEDVQSVTSEGEFRANACKLLR